MNRKKEEKLALPFTLIIFYVIQTAVTADVFHEYE